MKEMQLKCKCFLLRDDFFLNRKINGMVKWKMEQFNHLEEAHEELRIQFQTRQKEGENEK